MQEAKLSSLSRAEVTQRRGQGGANCVFIVGVDIRKNVLSDPVFLGVSQYASTGGTGVPYDPIWGQKSDKIGRVFQQRAKMCKMLLQLLLHDAIRRRELNCSSVWRGIHPLTLL